MKPVPVELQAILQAATLFLIAVAWTGVRLLDFVMEHMVERFKRRGQLAASVFLPPLVTAGKILVITIALLVWVDNLGFKVTTLLAGLGIGGLAVALAAQKSLENLIGAVTLYAAQPVSPGDFCRFGDKLGTVEEIGLRSTRLRTLDDSLLSVPNAEFATLDHERARAAELRHGEERSEPVVMRPGSSSARWATRKEGCPGDQITSPGAAVEKRTFRFSLWSLDCHTCHGTAVVFLTS